MNAFALSELDRERAKANKLYVEFLRVPALSLVLYVLPAGATDAQQPHREDEVYYVVRGAGHFRLGEEDHAVGAGSILFAPAGAPHCVHSITEELHVLVFFAPAEGTA